MVQELNIFIFEMYGYSGMQSFSHSEKQYDELVMQKKSALTCSYTCPLSALLAFH
jgi:hypothetical protein